jgi:hypothetical protein
MLHDNPTLPCVLQKPNSECTIFLFQKNLVLELETLKEMRIGMGRCLEMMQFIRKDLETMAEMLETLEGIVYYCQALNVILIRHNS